MTQKITEIYKYSYIEDILNNEEFNTLSDIFRTFRLQNPYIYNTIEYKLYDEQIRFNIPILIYISLLLNNILQKEKRNTLLLLTRDGCLLYKIFTYMFPDIHCMQYHSSRLVHINYDDNYKKYIKKHYKHDKCLLFDLSGSFSSGRKLYTEVFNYLPRIHIFHYDGVSPVFDTLTFTKQIPIQTSTDFCYDIECMNNDIKGTLIGMNENFEDIRAPLEINREYSVLQHKTVDNFIRFIDGKDLDNKKCPDNKKCLYNKNLIVFLQKLHEFYINNGSPVLISNNDTLRLKTLCRIYNYKISADAIKRCELFIDYFLNKQKNDFMKILILGILSKNHETIWNKYLNNKGKIQIFKNINQKNINIIKNNSYDMVILPNKDTKLEQILTQVHIIYNI